MTNIVSYVSTMIPSECLVEECEDQGCRVSLEESPEPHVLISMNCLACLNLPRLSVSKSSTRCDFIFASDDGRWIVPIELKSGQFEVNHSLRQLRAGAEFMERIVPKDSAVRFLPIIAHGGRIHPNQRSRLRRSNNRVEFRGKAVQVELLQCGQALTQALSRYPLLDTP